MPSLVADIGGSNARFAWLETPASRPAHVRQLAVAAHAGLVPAAQAYLAELRGVLGAHYRPPTRAALAVATAVTADVVSFTNSAWSFSQAQTRAALGLDDLLVLNDFEALALALPKLDATQARAHAQMPGAGGPMAVIGPGTGLGVAAVIPTALGWQAIPGEGGHVTLAAADDFESALLTVVRRSFEHVSAERLLSGIGLPVLHDAVCKVSNLPVQPTLASHDIVAQGINGEPACEKTLLTFCALLGGLAGNVALTVGARGGVYIGGGIVPRLGELFFRSDFRARFEAKGRFRAYLQSIPTALITDTFVALAGAAAALGQVEPATAGAGTIVNTNSPPARISS